MVILCLLTPADQCSLMTMIWLEIGMVHALLQCCYLVLFWIRQILSFNCCCGVFTELMSVAFCGSVQRSPSLSTQRSRRIQRLQRIVMQRHLPALTINPISMSWLWKITACHIRGVLIGCPILRARGHFHTNSMIAGCLSLLRSTGLVRNATHWDKGDAGKVA